MKIEKSCREELGNLIVQEIINQGLNWHKPGRRRYRGLCAEVLIDVKGIRQKVRIWLNNGECKLLDGAILTTIDLQALLRIQTGF